MSSRREGRSLAGGGPLYDQVYQALRDEIEAGHLRPGERLASERVIGERFDVSRITVRRALQQLASDGLIEGRRVASLGEPRNLLMSFTSIGAERGLEARSRVLVCRVRQASLDEAEQLRMAPGALVFELHRARLLGGLPIAIDESHLCYERVPGIEDVDFETASLYATLEDRFGIVALRADYSLEAGGATAVEAKILDLDTGAPVLRAAEVLYDEHEQPTDVGRITYRGDRYRFRTTLTRRPTP